MTRQDHGSCRNPASHALLTCTSSESHQYQCNYGLSGLVVHSSANRAAPEQCGANFWALAGYARSGKPYLWAWYAVFPQGGPWRRNRSKPTLITENRHFRRWIQSLYTLCLYTQLASGFISERIDRSLTPSWWALTGSTRRPVCTLRSRAHSFSHFRPPSHRARFRDPRCQPGRRRTSRGMAHIAFPTWISPSHYGSYGVVERCNRLTEGSYLTRGY